MIDKRIADFAAGCFWGVEEAFRTLPGVLATEVGYEGGTTPNATYEEVCSGKTGHAETTRVTYDAQKISYEELLKKFWAIHDPTTPDRQGPDIGTQYRSVIFYHTPEQQTAAELAKEALGLSKKYPQPIVTAIEPAREFSRAEEYHQKYVLKTGRNVC
jgi:peptide-methionine (S)-S-oxide reductase